MTERYEYCSTVPRTFVQDCSLKTQTWSVRHTSGRERRREHFPLRRDSIEVAQVFEIKRKIKKNKRHI